MNTTDRVLKWVGVGTLAFGAVPFAAVLVREVPGMVREVKIDLMGFRGGWKQAH